MGKLDLGWDIIESPDYWFMNNIYDTKYLLVSWRMSGSEFSKEFIWENFPSTKNVNWGKTHIILPNKIVNILKSQKTKVFFIFCDPRDAATHILKHDEGMHYYKKDFSEEANKNTHSNVFLRENVMIIEGLMDFYSKNFKENLIMLKYEDALYNKPHFLKQVSDFLNMDALNVNGNEKYKSKIYKKTHVFQHEFNPTILNLHYRTNIDFYKKWGYGEQ